MPNDRYLIVERDPQWPGHDPDLRTSITLTYPSSAHARYALNDSEYVDMLAEESAIDVYTSDKPLPGSVMVEPPEEDWFSQFKK